MNLHTASTQEEAALRRVGKLSPVDQEVVIWRHGLFGQPRLSDTEIAQRMNLAQGAVRVIERRALLGVISDNAGGAV